MSTGWEEPPYFEDLEVGAVIAAAPALTLTPGHASAHQMIVGDRLRLPLDVELSTAVTGGDGLLAHPGLVCDVAIGQSTLPTQRVIGNLFYRGLALRRAPRIGDTLRTTVEVAGLRQNRRRPGRRSTGLAVLHVRTVDQEDREILDFHRCAMLPLRDGDAETGRADEVELIGAAPEAGELGASIEGWRLDHYRDAVPGPHFEGLDAGRSWRIEGGDVVSGAPELARLTLNLAMAHHDSGATDSGRRLVYGGHTIGIACAHVSRALPALVTIVAWRSCDHLGPVFEGDTLYSEVALERLEALRGGGGLAHLRALTRARGEGSAEEREVLDWRLVGVLA